MCAYPYITIGGGTQHMALLTLTDPNSPWDRVQRALANPKYEFRTLSGITRETGLKPDQVHKLLDQHKDEVRVAYSTDREERLLYTLWVRPIKLQEYLSIIKTFVSSSSST